MPTNVNKRLRQIEGRLANIDRALGFLESRVYFLPRSSTEWIEVLILECRDQGVTPSNLRTGEQISAHRYSVRVSRDWLDIYKNITGSWAIAPDGNAANKLPCDLESRTINERDTFGTLDFRIAQTIRLPEPIAPAPISVPLPPPTP